MVIDKPAVEEIFILNPLNHNSNHTTTKNNQIERKREKSFEIMNHSYQSKVEISSEFQDSPLLKCHPDDKIESRLENIHDLAPMTLRQTITCKFWKKRSKSLKIISPSLDGILKQVVRDMAEVLIDIDDFGSLRSK